MFTFLPLPRRSQSLALTVFLGTLSFGASAWAQQVIVPSTVTLSPGTGMYTYSYSVTDATLMELAIVTVPSNANSALMNLTAPSGFGISFDPGNGLVSFFEDNDPNTAGTFAAGSTVGGFSFTSLYAPGTVTFDALDVSGNDYTGTTMSATNGVPEPTTMVLLFTGLLLAGGLAYRRRALRQPSLQ